MTNEELKVLNDTVSDEMKTLVEEFNNLNTVVEKAHKRQNDISKMLLRLEGKSQLLGDFLKKSDQPAS